MEKAACHFVFYTGPRKSEAQAFETARISIGRAGNCDFRLEAFQIEQVGTHHAEVLLEDGGIYCLYDLGTKAGTWVNGERVHERCTLMHEDYVRFGQEGPEVIFRLGRPTAGKQPLPQIFPVTAELEFFSGSDSGRIFPINAAAVSNIGRRADLEIPLDPRGDMIVSGNHCNIRYINGHFVLTDTSRNGTYVNSELLDQPMEILEGDAIMLGDGGPQARFHVDLAKRHYPNHRPLSPVVKPTREKPATSALPNAAGAADLSMSSAKPYSSGGPVSPEHDSEIPKPDPESVDTPATAPDHPEDFAVAESDMDAVPPHPDANVPPSDSTPVSGPAAAGGAFPTALSSRVPLTHKLNFKPGKKVILGAIAAVVLIIIFTLLPFGDDLPSGGPGVRGDYEAAIENLVPLENAVGAFNVQIPEGWTNLTNENYISVESLDKKIAVDYVRDPKLTIAKVQEIMTRNGAQMDANVEERTEDGVKLTTLHSSAGDVRRIATLHQAGAAAPAMAFLETTKAVMDNLDEDVINQLLVSNLELTAAAPPAAVATPAPKPTAEITAGSGLPTPSPAAPTPLPQAQPATPTPAAIAQTAPTPIPTPAGPHIESAALNLALYAPEGWTGASEEADAMLMLSDGQGMEIRLARDPGQLDAEATFKAMTDENWNKDGVLSKELFQAGEFSRGEQNLLLVLIPEQAKTTLVIYATSAKDFTPAQRKGISDIIPQLIQPQQ